MAVVTTFSSCQKDADVETSPNGNGAVAFSAESIAPLTRVSGTSWEEGDAIGIVAISQEGCDYDNVKYTAATGGTTVSFNPDSEVIYYREDGAALTFRAYHPYQEEWSYEAGNMTFDLSIQDGTAEAQSRVDLLECAIYDETEGEQLFHFHHALSKVQITVSNYDDVSIFEDLSSLSSTLYTNRTHYDMLTAKAVLSDEIIPIKMVESSNDGQTAVFTIIIAPDEVSDEIIFSDGTSHYSATLTIEDAYEGKQYNFTATVGDQGLTLVELTGDGVTDWEPQTDVTLGSGIEAVDGIYQISTADELTFFAQLVNLGNNSINGKLTTNINLEGSEESQWRPIGDDSNAYAGTFDGGGFEVSGLYIDSASSYQGLFGATNGATIANIGVSGTISGKENVGGIVGYSTNTSKVSNCYSDVDITAGKNVGGIVGWNEATVENCYNKGSIGGMQIIGGIVGYNYISNYAFSVTVENCYNVGKVHYSYYYDSSYSSSSSSRCGVVGSNASGSTTTNSYYDSSIEGTTSVVIFGTGDTTNVSGMTTDEMTNGTFAATLGDAFTEDTNDINGGYPILTWQATE